ncbi:hypothetical protein [Streptomyces sp. YIM B13518]|uniref:hypothetical protein n=1 Tax=Streptomyces sp. YIM B13518 TaxID=3366316 RepID=UPI0036BD961D
MKAECTVRLAAPLALHRAALQQTAELAGEAASLAARKAHRVYASRITTASTAP